MLALRLRSMQLVLGDASIQLQYPYSPAISAISQSGHRSLHFDYAVGLGGAAVPLQHTLLQHHLRTVHRGRANGEPPRANRNPQEPPAISHMDPRLHTLGGQSRSGELIFTCSRKLNYTRHDCPSPAWTPVKGFINCRICSFCVTASLCTTVIVSKALASPG